ncbi:butyrophilin subfamily 3 member A2-like isoform X2 [Dasypus novemcinctus]|uniref:butyrophilin subfamily 3 member A2-like isoform X2 n=1 Tax=Dasypus novemcinctus TaxID=9361 RepID=UPI00265FA5C4|nr:butyrophilin subfamily 1 member A1-like isoform X2 [Dasypus novemcinctus]XP_058146202.1 butyrophilin subfamily 1 member A1-like isoform X2 [Dasypus novemcinctus]
MEMKSPGRSPVMAPPCLVAGILLLHFMVSHADSGEFHVIGPKEPVIALVGEEAVLPCHLSPLMDAQYMEVKWYRDNPLGLVHQYENLQDNIEPQMAEYQGRTEVLKDNITKGLVALRIHDIRPSDGGEYRCSFESSIYFHQANFQVLVTGSGTAPHIHIDHGEAKGLTLTCTSVGWYPEPEVQWRDLQGQRLAPDSETKTPERNGVFHVETSITLDKSSKENAACYIRNPVLPVEKEVLISVTDALFPRVSPWSAIAPAIAVLLVIVVILSVLLMRARKSKGSLMKQNGELQEKYEEIKEKNDEIKEHNENLIRNNEETIKENEKTIEANEKTIKVKERTIEMNERKIEMNEKKIKMNGLMITVNENLIADNEKIIEDNEELRAGNEKVIADNVELIADNGKLIADNENLKTRNVKLTADNEKRLKMNEEIMKINEKIKQKNGELTKIWTNLLENLTKEESWNKRV